jgi:hypothetical protein
MTPQQWRLVCRFMWAVLTLLAGIPGQYDSNRIALVRADILDQIEGGP